MSGTSSPGRPVFALQVCDYAAPYPGSFIRQLEMLDEELGERGYGCCAFAFPEPAGRTEWFVRLRERGFPVHVLPPSQPNRPWHLPWQAVHALLVSTGCSVVHSHFGTYDASVALAARRLRRAGKRCVVMWHYRTALEQPVEQRSVARRCKDYVKFRRLGGEVDRFVAVTRALAQEAATRGAGARACAVVSGCDTDTFKPDLAGRVRTRRTLGIAEEEVVILHLGWHWRRKGGDLLVQAARQLVDRVLDPMSFLSVGAPLTDVQAPVRALPFTDRIHELHQAADIFVSASRSEGFGNGVVEGLASGSVVVASLARGQREIFEHLPGCRKVEIDDAGAIADAIESLIAARSNWPALGADNRRYIVDNYSMRAWARRMGNLYAELSET